MNCRKCRERLERFLDNELSGAERVALEQHLAVCPECRSQAEELKALGLLLQDRPQVEPEPGFTENFNDRFWHEVKRRRRMQSIEPGRGFFAFGWNRALVTAAAAMLLVAVGFVGYRSLHTIVGPTPVAMPEEAVVREPEPPKASGEVIEPRRQAKVEARPEVEAESKKSTAAESREEPAMEAQTAPSVEAPQVALPPLPVRTATQTTRAAERARLMADEKPPVIEDAESSTGYSASPPPAPEAKKQEFKIAEGSVKGGGGQPGKGSGGMGGTAKKGVDTNVYPEDQLSTKPKLISIPDASDDARRRYPDMEVSVWVLVEKDGSVSRAESRSTTDNAGLENVAVGLARQARFSPGMKAGVAVRAGKLITVKIRGLDKKDD
jgi:hypothetical protein